jgi:hypothetical protein
MCPPGHERCGAVGEQLALVPSLVGCPDGGLRVDPAAHQHEHFAAYVPVDLLGQDAELQQLTASDQSFLRGHAADDSRVHAASVRRAADNQGRDRPACG